MAKRDIVKELEERLFINPVGTVDVKNVLNSEHYLRASVRPDNPYLESINETHNNDQADWLIKQATDYDASVQAMYEKASLDYALSDPAIDIARKRAAGINPDYSGSGSGGSSTSAPVQGQNIDIASNSSSTPAEREHNRWQAAAQMLTGLTSLGNTIIGAVDTFSSLPSRIQLSKSQSNLADKQANLIDKQTPHLVNSALHSSNYAFTDSAIQNLAMYDKLATMFTSDSSDADITSLLQTLGYNSDSIPSHLQNFRNYQNNPAIQKLYADNRLEARKAVERGNKYSIEMYGREVQNQQKITAQNQNCELLKTNLQQSLLTYLKNEGYAVDVAGAMSLSAESDYKEQQLRHQQLTRDLSAFASQIDALALEFNSSLALSNKILNDCEINERDPSPEEQAILDSENIKRLRLNMLGSSQLQEVVSMMINTSHNLYWKNEYLNPTDGQILNFHTMDATKRFETVVFQDFVEEQKKGKSKSLGFVNTGLALLAKSHPVFAAVGFAVTSLID